MTSIADLTVLIPKRYRASAKAVLAFALPLIAQVVAAVSQDGLSLGAAIRSVLVSAVIGGLVYKTPNES